MDLWGYETKSWRMNAKVKGVELIKWKKQYVYSFPMEDYYDSDLYVQEKKLSSAGIKES